MSEQKEHTASIEELYLNEKKKSMLFMVGTAVFAILFVGSLVLGGNTESTTTTATTDQTVQAGQGQRGQGGPGGRGGLAISQYFNADGSIDQTEIDAFAAQISQSPQGADSGQFLDRIISQIDAAVASGEITQAQADALEAAFATTESEEI